MSIRSKNETGRCPGGNLQINSVPNVTGGLAVCLQGLIQKRAYELYEARGGGPGREIEDWLQAETEIKHHLNICPNTEYE